MVCVSSIGLEFIKILMNDSLNKTYTKIVSQEDINIPVVWTDLKPKSKDGDKESFGKLFISGEQKSLVEFLEKMILSAQETVVICSFLLADKSIEDAIEEVAKKGVRVYLMLASETHLDSDEPYDDFSKMCLDKHKKMLRRLGGKVMFRTASYYHAKAVLVDVFSDEYLAQGVLMTANLTAEALERNEEIAVILEQEEIKELVQIFKWAIFENAEHQVLDNKIFETVQPLGEIDFPKNSKTIVSTATGLSKAIQDNILKLINSAKEKLIISSFSWQYNHPIVDAICKQAKSGVKVIILARWQHKKSMEALLKIKKSGASVYGFKWLHAKAIWNDNNQGMVMSANLQKRGLDEGFEIGLKIFGDRAKNLETCLNYFCKVAQQELKNGVTLGQLNGKVILWHDRKFKEISVLPSDKKKLKDIPVDCITKLDNRELNTPNNNWMDFPFHKIEYYCSALLPKLPKGAEEVFQKRKNVSEANQNNKKAGKNSKLEIKNISYQPKVFKFQNKNFIAITEKNELVLAAQLKKTNFNDAFIVLKQ